MASVFWDAEGIIMVEYLEKGATITGSYYADQIRRLREAIKQKRRGKLRAGVLFHQDNAPSHKAAVAMAAIQETTCECNQLTNEPFSQYALRIETFLSQLFSSSGSSIRKDAVRTKQSTMAMLSLYEANVQMFMDVGKKSRAWKKISEGLKDLCIPVKVLNIINAEDDPPSEKNLPLVDESPKPKTTPVADVTKTARNQQQIQSMEIIDKVQENQKASDENMTRYLKMKEKEMELKKKAIDVRETEMQVKRDVASEKLKFNEKKHKDWLNIEKFTCELLKKLLKSHTDSEESD
ncbi:unnamed protein product [Pieris macdunnoughi]|uniref:Transposase n=2 Tax=Pieris macdunnoughi TaxID=345717 RepID=A0A821XJQ8_9NEOP|nr:unnamed protein product [Pieris macdunnoughi]